MTTATAERTEVKAALPTAPSAKAALLSKFSVTTANIAAIASTALAMTVRDNGIKEIETSHKDLKKLNRDIETRRIELKAIPLQECQDIDMVAKMLKTSLAPALEHLQVERDIYDAAEERRKAAIRAAEAAKIQSRIDRLTAAGCQVDLLLVQTLSDSAFDHYVEETIQTAAAALAEAAAKKAEADAAAAALAAEAAAEFARQQEELAIRAAELEAERAKMKAEVEEAARVVAEAKAAEAAIRAAEEAVRQADIAAERKKIDAEKAEIAAEQARLKAAEDYRKAEAARVAKIEADRLKAERAAEDMRAKNEEAARLAAEEAGRQQALLPEIEKAEKFASQIDADMLDWFAFHGDPKWSAMAVIIIRAALQQVIANVKEL